MNAAGGLVPAVGKGTKLWPSTEKALPACGPVFGEKRLEFAEPSQCEPTTVLPCDVVAYVG